MKMTDHDTPIRRLPLALPEKMCFSRLGYSRFRTALDEAEYQRILREMRRAFALCEPRGAWCLVAVTGRDAAGLDLAGGRRIESADIAARYGGAAWMWFAAATIGPRLPAEVSAWMAAGDSAAAVIGDAVGSESADAAMDLLQQEAAAGLRRRGLQLAERRFSPGYGDLGLEHQRLFLDILPLAEMGMTLHSSGLFLPEKSVTALAGVEEICG